MTEGKKQKQKRKRRLPSNGPNSPRQPGLGTRPSSSSRQPGCCRRGEHAGDAWPPPASPRPPLDTWRLLDVLLFHSPLHELPPLLSRSFPSPPENSPEHRNAPAWPSTSRSQTKVSREFVVVVFIDLRKESEPDASTSSLASSSSPPPAVDRLRIPATPAPPRASHHSR